MTDHKTDSIPEIFNYFLESCDKYLNYLVLHYAFNNSEPKLHPPECLIAYSKNNILLEVIYEYDDYPWIRLTISGKQNSLDNVIKEKFGGKPMNRRKGPSDPEKKIDFALKYYSEGLQQHIVDLLANS